MGDVKIDGKVWRCAKNDPPDGEPHMWSRAVIGVTDIGNAFRVSYCHGHEKGSGVWQSPAALMRDTENRRLLENFIAWTELPFDSP